VQYCVLADFEGIEDETSERRKSQVAWYENGSWSIIRWKANGKTKKYSRKLSKLARYIDGLIKVFSEYLKKYLKVKKLELNLKKFEFEW